MTDSAFVFDPRPDITQDSPYWQTLLMTAGAIDGNDPEGLYGALDGLRCGGARLELSGATLKLSAGDWADEYKELRTQWLMPHAEKLRKLLQSIGAMLARERAT